jgi:hypothetical protein
MNRIFAHSTRRVKTENLPRLGRHRNRAASRSTEGHRFSNRPTTPRIRVRFAYNFHEMAHNRLKSRCAHNESNSGETKAPTSFRTAISALVVSDFPPALRCNLYFFAKIPSPVSISHLESTKVVDFC